MGSTLRVQFLAGGVLSLLAWWLERDLQLSAQQMAQYLLAVHGMVSHHARWYCANPN